MNHMKKDLFQGGGLIPRDRFLGSVTQKNRTA